MEEGTVFRAYIEKWTSKGDIVYKNWRYEFLTRMQTVRGVRYALAFNEKEFHLGNYMLVAGNKKVALLVRK